MTAPIRVAVTGAAGQLCYSLLYMIARGEAFGKEQPIILQLLEIPEAVGYLEGVVMELVDCAFPLIREIIPTSDPSVAFKDATAAFLVASATVSGILKDRKDFLGANAKIFKLQGEALDQYACKDVKVLVIANPCNTNALVCATFAPSIPRENFSALTRLDQNRAIAHLAFKAKVHVTKIKNVIIWGNHSSTQFPDVSNAVITVGPTTKSAVEAIGNPDFLKGPFIEFVRKRAFVVLDKRKRTSAMSPAKAACDHMYEWWNGTTPGTYSSMAVMSDGSYGAPKDVIFSFPVEIKNKQWKIVQGLLMDDFARSKIEETGKELENEMKESIAILKAEKASLAT